jgi:hypothetical protein
LQLAIAIIEEAITTEPLKVQKRRSASARLQEDRSQLNAAFCGPQASRLDESTRSSLSGFGEHITVSVAPEAFTFTARDE